MELGNILEEYKDSVKVQKSFGMPRSKVYEIFVSPSKKEMDEVAEHNSIRFIATLNPNKLYVWNPNALHNIVARHLGIRLFNTDKAIGGIAEKKNGVWTVFSIFSYLKSSKEIAMKIKKKNWRWTAKRIAGIQKLIGTSRKDTESK